MLIDNFLNIDKRIVCLIKRGRKWILFQFYKKVEAMLSGHFLLSSGCHSDKYFQCAKLLQYPDKASLVLSVPVQEILAEKNAEKIDFDAVVGPAMGGIIPAYEFARQLGTPAFFTERNEDGDMVLRRGFEIKEGMKILLAEDVITNGRSTRVKCKGFTRFRSKNCSIYLHRRPQGRKCRKPL